MTATTGERRFALALGGGGARSLAHIGVLKVLAEEGLKPCAIAGTSIGAIVGALYAAGRGPDELETLVGSLGLKDLAGVAGLNLGGGSVLTADRIERGLRTMLPGTFEGLRLPFAAVAADLVDGGRVVLTSGDLPMAVRASMSIPIVFEPVPWNGRLLVDGGIVDPVPVDATVELCDAPVIAVDVGPLVPTGESPGDRAGRKPSIDATRHPGVIQVGTRSFDVMQHWLARGQMSLAAVAISPDVGGYAMADFFEGPALIRAGEEATRAALPRIREVLASRRRDGLLGFVDRILGR